MTTPNPAARLGGQVTGQDSLAKVIFAGAIGNGLEWYDLFVYGYLAIIIGKVFFPASNEVTSLLLATGTFGASYIMRPLGAAFIGSFTDRFGRKTGMNLTIWLMGAGTALIALSPTYAAIGLGAPILVVTGKLIQGFSAGGEYGSSVTFLTENGPPERKAFMGSFQFVGIGIGTGLASLAGMALHAWFTDQEITAWAWRLPFIFGLLIVPLGLFIRKRIHEAPFYTTQQLATETPLKTTLTTAKKHMAFAIGLYSLSAACNYLLHAYIPTYAIRQIHLNPQVAFKGALIFSLVQIVCSPFIGMLCDRFGKLRFITTGAVVLTLSTYPAFFLMLSFPTASVYLLVVTLLALLVTTYTAPIPAFLSEQFPQGIRSTGMGLIHNINFTVFGGFAPFICIYLIKTTGNKYVPAYFVLMTAIFAVAGLIYFHAAHRARKAQEKKDEDYAPEAAVIAAQKLP